MKLYEFFEEGLSDAKNNSPLILTGLACIGVVATSVISIFAGKKLQKKEELIKEKIEIKRSEGIELTKKETVILHVKEKFPALAPVVVGVIVTGVCIIGSYKISAKKIAGLTVALTATTKAFDGYKAATEKLLGEKEAEIQCEKIKQDILDHPPKEADEQKFLTQQKSDYNNNVFNGIQAFWEPLTKQPVYCTQSDIVRAFETVNYRVKSNFENFVPVADFLYELNRYSQNELDIDDKTHPEAQEAGWLYDRCGNYGIEYSNDFKEGVLIGSQYYGIIKYRAYWQASQNRIDYM